MNNMTYDELGKVAYTAFCQKARELEPKGMGSHSSNWESMRDIERACWIAASDAARTAWSAAPLLKLTGRAS